MKPSRTARGALAGVATREAELAASFHQLLRDRPELARRSHDSLIEAHAQRNLMFQGRLLCSSLRPRFLTPSRLDTLTRVSEVLAAVFERCGEALLASDRAMDLIGASESERDIWGVDPGYPGFTMTSRLDSFMVGDSPRFVEYNAESPAGIGYCDALSDVFDDLPALNEWRRGRRLERFHTRRHLLETLLWAYSTWGGSSRPSIAIVDWENVITHRDFELCAAYFREQGIPTVICDPRRLEYRSGKVWFNSEEITLVYRRVLLHELLQRAGGAAGMLDAYREGAICMVNSPRSKMLHKKALLALISEHGLGVSLSEQERQVVEDTVPWTRLVGPTRTTYHGSSVDLLGLLLSERQRFVLKPIDDYGGRGVTLGWETDADTWEQSLEGAVAGFSFVVQERVPIPETAFPIWAGETTDIVPMLVDTDPLLFRGRLGGVLTRISGSALLNVSAGSGSTTPTFIVEET